MPGRAREVPLPLKVRYAIIAVPILMASLDLFENGCLMLWTWPELEVSSLATQMKIMAGVVLLGALAVIWLMRWGIWCRA